MTAQRRPTDQTAKDLYDPETTVPSPRVDVTGVEQGTPTHIDTPQPIRVISMKSPTARRPKRTSRIPLHVQLRSLARTASEVPPVNLGRLAPPRDPEQARARHRRRMVSSIAASLAIAGAIALAIWLILG